MYPSLVALLVVFVTTSHAFYPTVTKKSFSTVWSRRATQNEREWSLSQTIEAPMETTKKVVPAAAAAAAIPPPLAPDLKMMAPVRELSNAKKTARIYRDGDVDDSIEKPFLLFLPGLDGVGAYSAPVIHKLNLAYDVWKLEISGEDRSTFLEIAAFVTQSMTMLFPGRTVVLVGESFGGLLASYLSLRSQNGRISNMVLINPATSFGRTRWETLGPLIANTGRAFPLVGLATLLSTAVDPDQFQRVGRKIISSINGTDSAVKLLNNMFDSAKELTALLSPKTLNWRVSKWLGEGSFIMENKYAEIKTPTLILTGKNDRLLPSRDEGRRLQKAMTGSSCVELKEYNNVRFPRTMTSTLLSNLPCNILSTLHPITYPPISSLLSQGHALLEDGYVDLFQEMIKSDVFLPPDRDVYDCKMPSSEDMADLEKQWGPLWKAMSPVSRPSPPFLPLSLPPYKSTCFTPCRIVSCDND